MQHDSRFLSAQAQRFGVCRFFPRSDSDLFIQEIVPALAMAKSEIVVVAVVEEWIQEQPEVPTPAEIYQSVTRHNEAVVGFKQPRSDCPRCEGSGWVIVERCGLSGADRCSCLT